MQADLEEHYRAFLSLGQPGIDLSEYAETKVPRYVKPFQAKLLEEVDQIEDRLPTTLPGFIEGQKVAFVGCSKGRAAFLLAAMVGEEGHIFAFDPDPASIDEAQSHLDAQMAAFGYKAPNLEFAVGFGEELPLEDDSVDVVVANALFNASPDQGRFLDEALRVLRVGGELCLASVFSNKHRLCELTRKSTLARANYLGGALYASDLRRMLNKRGIYAVRYLEKRRFNDKPLRKLVAKEVKQDLKSAQLYFGAVRTFKLFDLEDSCENYKLEVTYNGEAPGYEQFFQLDDTHRFFVDEPLEVCGNTYAFTMETRFGKYFSGKGDRSRHYGIYGYCEYCNGGIGAKAGKADGTKQKDYNFGVSAGCAECTSKDCASCE